MRTEGIFGQIKSHYPTLIGIDAWAKSIGRASLIPYSSPKTSVKDNIEQTQSQPCRNLERQDTQHILSDLEALPAIRQETQIYTLWTIRSYIALEKKNVLWWGISTPLQKAYH